MLFDETGKTSELMGIVLIKVAINLRLRTLKHLPQHVYSGEADMF